MRRAFMPRNLIFTSKVLRAPRNVAREPVVPVMFEDVLIPIALRRILDLGLVTSRVSAPESSILRAGTLVGVDVVFVL